MHNVRGTRYTYYKPRFTRTSVVLGRARRAKHFFFQYVYVYMRNVVRDVSRFIRGVDSSSKGQSIRREWNVWKTFPCFPRFHPKRCYAYENRCRYRIECANKAMAIRYKILTRCAQPYILSNNIKKIFCEFWRGKKIDMELFFVQTN